VLGAFSDEGKFVSFIDGLGTNESLKLDELTSYLKFSLSGATG
jgi:hypothetical protein